MSTDFDSPFGLSDGSTRLRKHRMMIEELIDPDHGLLDQLLELEALTRRQVHAIRSERTIEERNSRLIEFILTNDGCEKLFMALEEFKQSHIINFLKRDGIYSRECGDIWPLSNAETKSITRNQMALIEMLNCYELVRELYASNVLNRRQTDAILTLRTSHEQNEEFVDTWLRCSQKDHAMILACLGETKQSHLGAVVAQNGVMVKVVAKLLDASVDEEEIAQKITNILNSLNETEIDCEILSLKEKGLLAARAGQSVALYFLCKKTTELESLWGAMETGELRTMVEVCFEKFIPDEMSLKVTLVWSQKDFLIKRSILKDCEQEKAIVKTNRKNKNENQKEEKSIAEVSVPSSSASGSVVYVGSRVYGVTKLNGVIYVLSRSPNAIHCFRDKPPFDPTTLIKLSHSNCQGSDLASCPKTMSLYAVDAGRNCVWRLPAVDPTGIEVWLPEVDTPPWTISVNRETGSVLIPRSGVRNVLELYASDARILCKMQLPEEVVTPRHAVQLATGNAIVLHISRRTRKWELTEVNADAEVLHRIEYSTGSSSSSSLQNPMHIALDEVGRVFVADQLSNSVGVFDESLAEKKQQLLTKKKDGTEEPSRLFYDLDRRQLVVGLGCGSVKIHPMTS